MFRPGIGPTSGEERQDEIGLTEAASRKLSLRRLWKDRSSIIDDVWLLAGDFMLAVIVDCVLLADVG
jgi:hypothetical protein